MTRFREDSVRAARQKSADRIRKAKANARLKSTSMTDDARFFAERARANADLKRDRLENGYRRFGDRKLSGHYVGPIHEIGLRSETLNNAAAELFPALVPNAKRLRTSWGKTELETLGTKLFSLDEPYIEGNREFLGYLRIDTDRIWRSPEECRSFYEVLVADGRIACAPHFLVGLKLRDGSFVRPHAIWILPYGTAIWNAPGHPQWRSGPLDLFKSVYYGLCNALLEAGADPAAPATSQQVKNPLSPEWTTICMQDSHFPGLAEHAEYLDMSSRRENLIRRAADVQTGLDVTQSNVLFNALQRAAYETLRKWHFDADADYNDAMKSGHRGRLADNLHVALSERVQAMDVADLKMKDSAIELMIAKVSDFAVASWDPIRASRSGSSRGIIRHIVEGLNTVKERRQAAAAYTTSRKMEKSLHAMLTAIQRLEADGKAITKSAVARESGLSRQTVTSRWSDLEAALSAPGSGCPVRCIDKKVPCIPAVAVEEKIAEDTVPEARQAEPVQPTPMTGEIYADRDEDWNEIEQRESWLASAECEPPYDDLEPESCFGIAVNGQETGHTAATSDFRTADPGNRNGAARWDVFPHRVALQGFSHPAPPVGQAKRFPFRRGAAPTSRGLSAHRTSTPASGRCSRQGAVFSAYSAAGLVGQEIGRGRPWEGDSPDARAFSEYDACWVIFERPGCA